MTVRSLQMETRKRKRESTNSKYFKKERYVKPTILERIIGKASIVWNELTILKLSEKGVAKWTIKQKEEYIKVMNKYLCISTKDDVADCGNLYGIVEEVNRYLLDGKDDAMLNCLDPDYIVVDFLPPGLNLEAIDPPVSVTVPIRATEQSNTYFVNNRGDGDYLLGKINARWPGSMGFVVSSPSPLTFRF
jgi:hypothetical protein